MKIFAKRLRELRTQRGESRKEFGKAVGLSVSQVSDLENDYKGTTLERFAVICQHLNVSADYLLGFSDEP